MKNKEIFKIIEDFAPISLAEEWDRENDGIQIGSAQKECTAIMVCLDLTMEVAKKAVKKGCNLILTHHPFLFNGVKTIDLEDSKGALISYLIKNDITVYSAHTNLDKTEGGISYMLATKFNGANLKPLDCGYLFTLNTSLLDLAKVVKTSLNDNSVKYIGKGTEKIKKVFVISGAGFSDEAYALAKQNADCLITGDLKQHQYIMASEDSYPIIEYSHYASEIIVEDIYVNLLKNTKIKVYKSEQKCPFNLLEV